MVKVFFFFFFLPFWNLNSTLCTVSALYIKYLSKPKLHPIFFSSSTSIAQQLRVNKAATSWGVYSWPCKMKNKKEQQGQISTVVLLPFHLFVLGKKIWQTLIFGTKPIKRSKKKNKKNIYFTFSLLSSLDLHIVMFKL